MWASGDQVRYTDWDKSHIGKDLRDLECIKKNIVNRVYLHFLLMCSSRVDAIQKFNHIRINDKIFVF